MLLKDSIGGNCKTTLIGCVSPSYRFCRETNYTLDFAKNFKKIKNVIKVNKYKKSIPISIPVKLKQNNIENNKINVEW